MFMMIFYISRVTDLTYAKSAPVFRSTSVLSTLLIYVFELVIYLYLYISYIYIYIYI